MPRLRRRRSARAWLSSHIRRHAAVLGRRRHGERGFTLLEVLVAFTILALMMTVLLRIFSEGFRGMSAADTHAVAAMHAQSALAGVGADVPLRVGDWSGDFADGFRWSIRIEPYAEQGMASEPPMFVAYAVSVVVDNGRGAGRVSLASLRISQAETFLPEGPDGGRPQ